MERASRWPEEGLAHDTGRLYWGMWLCDCDECTEVCRRSPEVLLVIKGSSSRDVITARQYVEYGPDALVTSGYVREVFVADQWRGRFPPRRAADGPPAGRIGHTRSLHECRLLDLLAQGNLPRPSSLSMVCACGDNPFGCAQLAGMRDLAAALEKAFASQSFADLEPAVAPQVLWRMPGSPDAELPRSEVLSRLQIVCDEGLTELAEVMISPESIHLGFEITANGRVTQLVIQFVAEDAVVTEIFGPCVRQFAPIPDPVCATRRPPPTEERRANRGGERS